MSIASLIAVTLLVTAPGTPGDRITPREFPVPKRTDWRPSGCRTVPIEDPVLPSRDAFRRAHGDLQSTNEVNLAYAPVFTREWVAETGLYQVTTPAFDSAGNLYMTPLLPHESILLISLDPTTGARRFVIPLADGERGGGMVPMILHDPETDSELVYINAYERMVAVHTDGSPAWDVPTGLGAATTADRSPIGLAWVPNADAIVGLTRDGYVLLHDRRTGAPLLAEPFQLPGERTPPLPSTVPPSIAALVDTLLQPLVTFTPGHGVLDLINVLLGGDSEVANNLSVDARNNRLWIAASARDDEDGIVDGISELGAIYRYDVVPDGNGWRLAEICHRNFEGGSASTPTLGQNGTRVYLGDDAGAMIAINAEDCSQAWSVTLDSQIFGSIAASSDNNELYAGSASGIFQVLDDDNSGRRGWTASLDLYDIPPDLTNYSGLNLLLAGIGANGLLIQAGAGLRNGTQALPVRTGIAHVDRLTGKTRWFADGLEESLGAMSTGPDGALYLPHAPLRRAFTLALAQTQEPLLGGISKWSATRYDLVARDAACAAADRAANAAIYGAGCPNSAVADLHQVEALRAQLLDAADRAVTRGELRDVVRARVQGFVQQVGSPPDESAPASPRLDKQVSRYHRRAALALRRACRLLATP